MATRWLGWLLRARVARAYKDSMPQELNWCGWPIGPGESYYGGKPAAKKHQHFAVITEGDLAEVFGNGAYKLTRAEAAKLLEALTDCHRTTCYRALRLNGRFARHLYTDGTMLSWR
jgi:hypothetical protein